MQNTFLFRRLWQTKWNKIMKFSKLYSLGFQMIHHGDCHMKFFRIKQCCYCWLIVGSFPFKFLRTKMTPIKVKNKFTILKSTVWISVHQKLRTSTVDVPFWAHSFFEFLLVFWNNLIWTAAVGNVHWFTKTVGSKSLLDFQCL